MWLHLAGSVTWCAWWAGKWGTWQLKSVIWRLDSWEHLLCNIIPVDVWSISVGDLCLCNCLFTWTLGTCCELEISVSVWIWTMIWWFWLVLWKGMDQICICWRLQSQLNSWQHEHDLWSVIWLFFVCLRLSYRHVEISVRLKNSGIPVGGQGVSRDHDLFKDLSKGLDLLVEQIGIFVKKNDLFDLFDLFQALLFSALPY